MNRNAFLLLFFLAIGCTAAAQKPLSQPTQPRWWRGKFTDAFTQAKLRNVPILLVIIQDGEEANERVADGVLSHKSFVALTEQTVPVICSRMDHDTKAQKIDGRTLHVCTKFGHVACSTHRRQEAVMYKMFFSGKQLSTPQVLVILPDQTVVDQIIDVAGPAAYASAVKKATKSLGRGMSRRTFGEATKALSLARTALANSQLGPAWNHAARVLELGGNSGLKAEGAKLQKSITQAIDKQLKAIGSAKSEEETWSSLELCEQLGKQLKGTPLGARLKKAERSLKRTKSGRRVAALMKRQARVMPLWQKAMGCLDQSDYQKAYRYLTSVAEKARGAPVGKRAIERLEGLESDRDLSAILEGLIQERRAGSLLSAARAILAREPEEARALLQQLVKKYPQTRAAKSAKRLIER